MKNHLAAALLLTVFCSPSFAAGNYEINDWTGKRMECWDETVVDAAFINSQIDGTYRNVGLATKDTAESRISALKSAPSVKPRIKQHCRPLTSKAEMRASGE